MPAGYSGTPLAKKLGYKEGFKILLYNQPKNYFDMVSDMPDNVEQIQLTGKQTADLIHLFCTNFNGLRDIAKKYIAKLKKNGMLWISWPKGISSISSDLKRDTIREYILDLGLVDVKVAAIDENWSGLKFVYRLKDRKGK